MILPNKVPNSFGQRMKAFIRLLADIHKLVGPHKLIVYAAAGAGLLVALADGLMAVLAADFIFLIVGGEGSNFGLAKQLISGFGFSESFRQNPEINSLLLILAASFLNIVLQGTVNSLHIIAAKRVTTFSRTTVIDKVLTANFRYLDRTETGWIREITTANVQGMVKIVLAVMRLLGAILTGVVLFAILISISAKLMAITAIFIVIFLPIKLFLAREIFRLSQDSSLARLDLMQQINETLTGIRQIKLQNRQRQFRNFIDGASRRAEKKDQSSLLVDTWEPLIIQLLLFGLIAVLITQFSTGDKIEMAEILSFLLILYRASGPAVTASHLFNGIMKKLPPVAYVLSLYNLPTEYLEDGTGDQTPLTSAERVRLDNVSHSYTDGKQVLNNVSLEAKKGEFIAIVGPSGAGKSSLVHLLLRMYEPSSGSIFLDDVNIKNIHADSLRNAVGLVSQDVHLFNLSINDLISGGQTNLDDQDIVAAAKASRADEFITGLERGYETLAGERGITLSGGQRQRLFIAQILARKTPIVIFDEATSALDTLVEGQILEELNKICAGKILIVITHRLEMIREADRIYVFDEGRIAESGDWTTLIERNGLFKSMLERGADRAA